MTQDGRRLRGQRSRETILAQAVGLASVEGLDGLSLGRLAAEIGISKSGFFAHWRDKQELQLDAVDWAVRQWREHIVVPALHAPAGQTAVRLHQARLRFYAERVLPGGCFFLAVQAEFDDHPGAVRTRIVQALHNWEAFIRSLVEEAIALGELDQGVDPAQLAYEIEALGMAAVPHSRLLDERLAFAHARRTVLQRLRGLCPNPSLLPED